MTQSSASIIPSSNTSLVMLLSLAAYEFSNKLFLHVIFMSIKTTCLYVCMREGERETGRFMCLFMKTKKLRK